MLWVVGYWTCGCLLLMVLFDFDVSSWFEVLLRGDLYCVVAYCLLLCWYALFVLIVVLRITCLVVV